MGKSSSDFPIFPGMTSYSIFIFGNRLNDDFKITGLLKKTESGQWHITQRAMLWWLTDELIAALHDDTFERWLQAQELDGILTNEQRKKLQIYAEKVFELAHQGSALLIEAIADCIAKDEVINSL
ncbi:MAG: hypothetical protein GY749_12090 [Desulfobacteraceae bacterium]|nr:hypothetical protein [Desulfobacteraceae bacterium]